MVSLFNVDADVVKDNAKFMLVYMASGIFFGFIEILLCFLDALKSIRITLVFLVIGYIVGFLSGIYIAKAIVVQKNDFAFFNLYAIITSMVVAISLFTLFLVKMKKYFKKSPEHAKLSIRHSK
jgi:Na+-driven multidrug efflux pump